MNYHIFELINSMARKYMFIDNVMIFSSKYLPFLMALMIGVIFLLGVVRHDVTNRKNAVITALLITVNLLINLLIGCFLYIPRPFVKHKVNLLFPHVEDSSFPSDHATVTMSTAVGFMRVNRILGWVSVSLSLLVGFSRVYVGHHYPVDVLGSYLIVIVINMLFHKFLENKVSALYFRLESFLTLFKSNRFAIK